MVSIGKAYAIEHYHRQYYRPSRAQQTQRTLMIIHQTQMVHRQMITPAGTRISKLSVRISIYIWSGRPFKFYTRYARSFMVSRHLFVCAFLKENRFCLEFILYINNLAEWMYLSERKNLLPGIGRWLTDSDWEDFDKSTSFLSVTILFCLFVFSWSLGALQWCPHIQFIVCVNFWIFFYTTIWWLLLL